MNRDQSWLMDAQFSKIEPHLPTDTRGKARVDDRRVISGIVHVLKSGDRWSMRYASAVDRLSLNSKRVDWSSRSGSMIVSTIG